MRFWFPPAVVQGATPRCAVGFSFLGIPVCLNPVFSPRVWTLRGFSGSAALCPIREGAPQIHDDGLNGSCIALPPALAAVFTQACHLQEPLQLVDAVLLHGLNYNTDYKQGKKRT